MFSCIKRLKGSPNEQANVDKFQPSMPRPTGQVYRKKNLNPNGLSVVTNGQISNVNSNNHNNYRARHGSFDANQILTYRKVMGRVIKRFLLHKQREEQEEIREGDFEELKQDIQMLRFELLNRLDETRDDLYKNSHLLNEGVVVVGDLLSLITNNTNTLVQENFHLFKKSFYSRKDSGIESVATTLTTLSMPTSTQEILSSVLMTNSKSTPTLLSNNQEESDINPINAVKLMTAEHIGLSEIVEEEEEERLQKSFKYIDDDDDDEEEVEGRHMAVQTSRHDHHVSFSKF
jgi:hypothetical protein